MMLGLGIRGGVYRPPIPEAPPVDLATMPGLVAWVSPRDAADYSSTTVKNKATNVDGVVNGRSGVPEPTALNGFPGWTTDGVDDRVLFSGASEAAIATAMASGPYTIFYVTQYTTLDQGRAVLGIGNSGTSTANSAYWGQSSGGTGRLGVHNVINTSAVPNPTFALLADRADDTSIHVHCWFRDVSGNVGFEVDGNEGADPAPVAAAVGAISVNRWCMWARPDSGPDLHAIGVQGDQLISSAYLTRAQRQAYAAALMAKYGFARPALPSVTNDPNVIDVIMFVLSQSNGSGFGKEIPEIPSGVLWWPRIVESGIQPTALAPLSSWVWPVSEGGDNLTYHGTEITLCRLLKERGLNPCVYKYTWAGNPLKQTWDPTTGNSWGFVKADFANFQAALFAQYPGKTFRYHAITFNGEAEASGATSAPTTTGYQADLTECIVDGLRAAAPGGLGLTNCSVHITVLKYENTSSAPIRQAQRDTAAALTNCYAIETDAVPFGASNATLHYGTPGHYELALRHAASILNSI